jgi:hypothetical protein
VAHVEVVAGPPRIERVDDRHHVPYRSADVSGVVVEAERDAALRAELGQAAQRGRRGVQVLAHVRERVVVVAGLEEGHAVGAGRREDRARGGFGSRDERGRDHRDRDPFAAHGLQEAREIFRRALRGHVPARPHGEIDPRESERLHGPGERLRLQRRQMLGEEAQWPAEAARDGAIGVHARDQTCGDRARGGGEEAAPAHSVHGFRYS